jgi:Leucine-rich repeat (LRR) protein
MPKLPVSLEELDISNTQIKNLSDLHDLGKLRSLTLHAGQLESLAELPESVTQLYFVERVVERK